MTFNTGTRRRTVAGIALVAVAALGLAACATGEESGADGNSSSGEAQAVAAGMDATLYKAAVAEARSIAGDEKLAATLDYVGGQSGGEAQTLETAYMAFTDGTGTKINYAQSGSSVATTAAIRARIAAGNPPDVTDQSLGQARQYAQEGHTADLSTIIGDSTLADNYPSGLLQDLSVNGQVFGVPQGFSNFMVWYNPQNYTGPTAPTTWKEVADWTTSSAADGAVPWCNAQEAGAGSGFPGTQFIQTLFAKANGPEAVTAWSTGVLPWTSPKVKSAWEEFGAIALDDSKVAGGVTGSLSTSIAIGSNGLIASPSTCQADLWGSWVPGLIGDGVEPETNIDFYQVPGIVAEFASTEVYNAGATIVLKESPTSTAFIKWIASSQAQALLASADLWTVANTNVPTSTYGSPLLQKAAGIYFSDNVTLVAPPDIMAGGAVTAAFNKGVVSYLSDPGSLDDVLATIEKASKGN